MATKSKFYKEINDGKLDLSMQNLREIPLADLELLGKRLKVLDLSRNQITSIPDGFGALTSLVEVDLGQNGLSNLPNSISDLLSLKRLILAGNAITKLPEDFVNLQKLYYLDLKGNPLSPHLQDAAGDCSSKYECEKAAIRACLKKKGEMAKKQEREDYLEKQRVKEEKLRDKERRRKAWDQEQLRKKMEAEIFGSLDGELKENGDDGADSDHQPVEDIVTGRAPQRSRTYSLFILTILVAVLAYIYHTYYH